MAVAVAGCWPAIGVILVVLAFPLFFFFLVRALLSSGLISMIFVAVILLMIINELGAR